MSDKEFGTALRVVGWVILAIFFGVLGAWVVSASGWAQLTLFVLAGIFGVASAFEMPFIIRYITHGGIIFFAFVTMIATIIPGMLIFGWTGWAYMVACLVVYLIASRVALSR